MKTTLFLPVFAAACVTGAGVFNLAQAGMASLQDQEQVDHQGDGIALVDIQWKQAPGQRGAPQTRRQLPFPERSAQNEREDPGAELRRMLEQLRGSRGGSGGAEREEEQAELDFPKFMERMMRGMGHNPETGGASEASRYSKDHRSTLAEWRPLVQRAREATVRVLSSDRQVALATIVSPDGYALTKASEMPKQDGELECEFHDGRIVSASVVDQLEAYDLALLKLNATGLPSVTFSSEPPVVGTLIAAVNTDEDPRSVGVISVPSRSLNERSKGFLGVGPDLTADVEKGVAIKEAVDGGAAKRAGIEAGDILLSINGEEINFWGQLQKRIASLSPDEEITVRVKRGTEEKEFRLSLGSRADVQLPERMLDTTARMGSSLSGKSSGFPNAVQSDLGINAEDCGGPVVDVNGSVVGLNIARAERVSTYMVPGSALIDVLTNVREGKFTLARDPDTLKGELREYERAMKEAQNALQAAEERRDAAREALERLQPK